MKSFNFKSKFFRIAIIVIILFFAFFLISRVANMGNGKYKTQTAFLKTVEEGIETTVFIVRDEQYLGKIDKNKTSVSLVSDGERVAENELIAAQFDSEEDAENYKQRLYYESELDRYNSLLNQEKINISDIKTYDDNMNFVFQEYVDSIRNNSFVDARENLSEYCKKITSRQSAMGDTIQLENIINDLNSKVNSLKSVSPDFVISKSTGYFVNGVDGYENIIKYKDVKNVTVEMIENALKSEKESDESYAGKIIDNFNWYMLCVVTAKDVQNLEEGDSVNVRFENAASMEEKAIVEKINTESKDKVALVLKCNNVTSKEFPLRKEKVKIITDKIEGYSINKDAVRSLDGLNGVYILRGKIVNFRYIDIIYTGDDFLLVRTYEDEINLISQRVQQLNSENLSDEELEEKKKNFILDSSKYIRLYDDVIVKGSDLSDGKLIQ